MAFEHIILYALAVIVGLRAIWIGGRSLRKQTVVHYPWPLNKLAPAQPVEEQDITMRVILRAWSAMRLFFGLVLVGLGVFGLWAAYLR